MNVHETVVIGRRYCLLSLIGKGGFGRVYRADDMLERRSVALKFMWNKVRDIDVHSLSSAVYSSISSAGFNTLLSQELALAREYEILASLRHPNIVSVLDYGFDTEDHYPYVAIMP